MAGLLPRDPRRVTGSFRAPDRGDLELTDGAVILRPVNLSGAEAHLAGDDAETVRWLSDGASTLDTVTDWIVRMRASWHAGGPAFAFFVFDAGSGEQVGMVHADTDWPSIDGLTEGQANLSYVTYPAARGRGYATRAVALIQSFLATRGVRDAVIRVDPENLASIGVALRSGFSARGDIVTRDGDLLRVHVRRIAS